MSFLLKLWSDESGSVLSAEAVMVGTIAVVGITTGLKMASTAVNDEMVEVSQAIRSLDQSYRYQGYQTERAFTASSEYRQRDVGESLRELQEAFPETETDDADAPGEKQLSPTGRLLVPTPPEDPSAADSGRTDDSAIDGPSA